MHSPGVLRVNGATVDMHGYLIKPAFAKVVSRELSRVSTAKYAREAGASTACDVVMARLHNEYAAYAVWPPLAWQREGWSNNEHRGRCNYCPDGTQRILRENIEHLLTAEQKAFYAKWSAEEAARQKEWEERRRNPPRTQAQLGRVTKACAAAFVPNLVIGVDGKIVDPTAVNVARAELSAVKKVTLADLPKVFHTERVPTAGKGIVLSPYSWESEKMAFALVASLRRHNSELPVAVLAQDYICALPWKQLPHVLVESVRAAAPHRSDRMWFNKLGAIWRSPFAESIFLDCVIVLLADPEPWFSRLGTDDFTCFHRQLSPRVMMDKTEMNLPNAHRMQERFGVESTPFIDGGGHFFFRQTARGRALALHTAQLMEEALRYRERSLYGQMAGQGNLPASDELAYSLTAVMQDVKLPEENDANSPVKPIGVFLPPHQTEAEFDLNAGKASFHCGWVKRRIAPQAVHFCHNSKSLPAYQSYIQACLEAHAPPRQRSVVPAQKLRTRDAVPAKFLFDLGHHHGEGMRHMRALYAIDPSWTVIALEPNSACAGELALAAARDGVLALPMAAACQTGPMLFQREAQVAGGREDGQGSHLAALDFTLDTRGAGQETVWAVDFPKLLQALVPKERRQREVIVKMDIEGAEYSILRQMLADGSIDLVDTLHVEFHDRLMPSESPATTVELRAALEARVKVVEHW
jgi:FkbM family methyltransferase